MTVEDRDTMPAFSVLMLLGLAAAVVLAVIGGAPVDLPMPTWRWGWVEPTCGLTRGSTAVVRGDIGRAWAYNPASLLVMGIGAFGVARFVTGRLTGHWVTVRISLQRWGWLLVVVAVLVLWAHQQLNAEFVMHARG